MTWNVKSKEGDIVEQLVIPDEFVSWFDPTVHCPSGVVKVDGQKAVNYLPRKLNALGTFFIDARDVEFAK